MSQPPSPFDESDLPEIITEELGVLRAVIPALLALQDEEREAARTHHSHAVEMYREWRDALGDRAQREAYEEAMVEAARRKAVHATANRAREVPLGSPYFARLQLKEKKRSQQVLLGKVGVVDRRVAIVDWRNAPISRLYYDYEEGEEYEEEFGGSAREGIVHRKRRVDIHDGQLQEVAAGETVLRRNRKGQYTHPDAAKGEREDHRLPDIVSLITRDQFHVITRPEAGVVLLRGRAGSGKTTVALHRVAWLHYQDPERFRGDKVLVVMFNKALQTYISRVLPDLGLEGVPVETFHGWAGRMLKAGCFQGSFRAAAGKGQSAARLKRHPAIESLLQLKIVQLAEKTEEWLASQITAATQARWEATAGAGLSRAGAFRRLAPELPIWPRLQARLLDHSRDLYALFDDEDAVRACLPAELHRQIAAAREHQAASAADSAFDWEDAAILLRLGQMKRQLDPALPCPWAGVYAHIVIDEAQDLSTVEIQALVEATDAGRSVTIAGDPAQKILADAQFEGFEQLLQRLAGGLTVRLDALNVGHRSSREIMALALQAIDKIEDPRLIASRDGAPVEWIEEGDAVAQVAAALSAYRAERPRAFVAVLARGKGAADDWARRLHEFGLPDVRRVSRADFSFTPGVVVSNVHQVKGLEFDGVVLIEPKDFGLNDRQLLHVALTRAADRLWVVATRGRGVLRRA
jgi:DNA helicase-2/ATP-dependent DNA helicase PcrA